jgi:predicted ribosome quality control (RQC) complex YloA/Tae2 family protein
LALAQEYGITRFPAPAGGCLLTDPRYATRLKELLRHVQEATRGDLELLKYGRHFRLPGGAKAVVGRIQRENEAIETLISPGDFLLKVVQYPGPLVLGRGVASEADLAAAAGLAAAYSDAPEGTPVTVTAEPGGSDRVFRLTTPAKDRFKPWLV